MTLRDRLWQIAAVGWLLFVWGGLTAVPDPRSAPFDWVPFLDVPGFDKVLHAGLFFVTGFFLARLLAGGGPDSRPSAWRSGLLILGVGVVFGAATEFAQISVPGREASWLDVVADSTGSGFWWALVARRGGWV